MIHLSGLCGLSVVTVPFGAFDQTGEVLMMSDGGLLYFIGYGVTG